MFLFFLLTAVASNVVTYRAPAYQRSWTVLKPPSEYQDISFTLCVRHSNLDQLRSVVAAVSDPTSSDYGEYLTSAQIEELTRPSQDDVDTVTGWLAEVGLGYTVVNHRDIVVSTTIAKASHVLSTSFSLLANSDSKIIRAGSFSLPDHVHQRVGAVFGLHGLPLPRKKPLDAPQPAAVTPDVLATTYRISGVTPSGSVNNRQAVAEFQGQYMKESDLVDFFAKFVPNAQDGDDQVYKFVGSENKNTSGVEASLDIQYIMGVAPHVKTEFWLFAGQDFCKDLKNWTDQILADDSAPLVHSVSYGWQGNLTKVGCDNDSVNYVDANFAKLAAKGITIIFSSGDSGSGYAPPRASCPSSSYHQNTALTGTVGRTFQASSYQVCCDLAGQDGAAGFQWAPPAGPPQPGATCSRDDVGTKDIAYSGTPERKLQVHGIPNPQLCCELGQQDGPYFSFTATGAETFTCSFWKDEPQNVSAPGSYAGRAKARVEGTCSLFTTVSGTTAKTGYVSGSPETPQETPIMWPSWPASSPYVTSVGATRFVDQTVGQPEMATDQFGSGGGFSFMFDRTNAQWQEKAVSHYTSNPPADPHYPPAGSFPPGGRATPDVSALGEGYQVFVSGRIEAVGGTSASAPAFAGMVALLNEARQQNSKSPLGFLNPFLYQHADAFKDVTLGTNAIGRGTGPIKYGFNCTQGWDPATGLGTPIFDKLLDAALNTQ